MKMRVVDQGAGWGVESDQKYLAFPKQDETGIAVTMWAHMVPVESHRHRFHELVLITKGSCTHEYRGVKTSLVPGDMFYIAPGEYHSFEINAGFELLNCQFFSEMLGEECNQALEEARSGIGSGQQSLDAEWQRDELLREMFGSDKEEGYLRGSALQQANMNRQGILHLNLEERKELEYWLDKLMEEQEQPQVGSAHAKSAYLQMLLVFFRRCHGKKLAASEKVKDFRKETIYRAVEYMDNHLEEKIDMEELAASVYWSSRHFRSVFKEVMGTTPVEYLNRIRIIKSLEYLERSKCNIAEVGARVGIYDANYYTRLFKKILGYSPKYFKGIR